LIAVQRSQCANKHIAKHSWIQQTPPLGACCISVAGGWQASWTPPPNQYSSLLDRGGGALHSDIRHNSTDLHGGGGPKSIVNDFPSSFAKRKALCGVLCQGLVHCLGCGGVKRKLFRSKGRAMDGHPVLHGQREWGRLVQGAGERGIELWSKGAVSVGQSMRSGQCGAEMRRPMEGLRA
jgi:hypothetical protein